MRKPSVHQRAGVRAFSAARSGSGRVVAQPHNPAAPRVASQCTTSQTAARKGTVLYATKQGSGDPMTIAITGATGLVGSRLVARLTSQGARVKVLTRNVNRARGKLPYSNCEFVGPSDWGASLAGCYGVVNLAGEPIATRWSERIKQEIMNSRISVTSQLARSINDLPEAHRPKVLVSSSAVGYYGTSQGETFKEGSSSGRDFLSEICRRWEAAAAEAHGCRIVTIRTGVVLSKDGGALAKMIPVFQLFTGGPLGSGSQWMSWIHLDDLVDLMIEALRNDSYEGVYNGTAPNPVRMSELCANIGTIMGRPSWLPVPDFALQGLLGEGAQVVLEGQKVLPVRTQKEGYKFKYSTVDEALRNLLRS